MAGINLSLNMGLGSNCAITKAPNLPVSGETGQIYYRSTDAKYFTWDGKSKKFKELNDVIKGDLPELGESGKLYYNNEDGNYYRYIDNTYGWENLNKSQIINMGIDGEPWFKPSVSAGETVTLDEDGFLTVGSLFDYTPTINGSVNVSGYSWGNIDMLDMIKAAFYNLSLSPEDISYEDSVRIVLYTEEHPTPDMDKIIRVLHYIKNPFVLNEVTINDNFTDVTYNRYKGKIYTLHAKTRFVAEGGNDERLEAITEMTVLDVQPILENVTYYFPKLEVSLKFKSTFSGTYTCFTSVESLSKRIISPPENDYLTILCTPGAYLNFSINQTTETTINLDTIIKIPEFETIDIMGRFFASDNNSNFGVSTLGLITRVSDNNPVIEENHTYEYHFMDGVLTFFDITSASNP